MTEKRYISTEYLGKCETCKNLRSGGCNTYCDHGEEYSPNLAKIPTVDVVEVVRCENCKRARPTIFSGFYYCKRVRAIRKENDFCSKGILKEEISNERKTD